MNCVNSIIFFHSRSLIQRSGSSVKLHTHTCPSLIPVKICNSEEVCYLEAWLDTYGGTTLVYISQLRFVSVKSKPHLPFKQAVRNIPGSYPLNRRIA